MLSQAELEDWLSSAVASAGVPGAAAAVVTPDTSVVAASGTRDTRAHAPVTRGTTFRLGSVTKVLNATLVMRHVQAGRIALDDLLSSYVPEFPGGGHWDQVSVRHALAKSDGLQDFVAGFGDGDDAIAAYVQALGGVGFVHSPGEMFSYGNPGAVVLGRLLERVHDRPYNALLADELLGPLGMESTVALSDSTDLLPPLSGRVGQREVAICHTHSESGPIAGGGPWPPPVSTPRALAPCGATLATTIDDLAAFVTAHLVGGTGQLLRTNTVSAMRNTHASTPAAGRGSGLGWLTTLGDPHVAWHAGGSRPIGSFSFIATHSAGFGIALLANSPRGHALAQELLALTRRAHGDLTVPPKAPIAPVTERDLVRCSGAYERLYARFEFTVAGTGLQLDVTPGQGGSTDGAAHASGHYNPLNPTTYLGPGGLWTFIGDGEHSDFVFDGRAARRLTT